MKLKPWTKSYMLTETRTNGEIGFRKNGDSLDIWLRVNGRAQWFAVDREAIGAFLATDVGEIVLMAGSDGNDETHLREDAEAVLRALES